MDIETIITAVLSALGGGGIGSFIGWRAKKRQDNADAAKTEAEAKGDQIENIEKLVEKAYKPIIEDLTRQIKALQEKVEVDLYNTLGFSSEPEAVFIWNGHICIAFRNNANVYALYFE